MERSCPITVARCCGIVSPKKTKFKIYVPGGGNAHKSNSTMLRTQLAPLTKEVAALKHAVLHEDAVHFTEAQGKRKRQDDDGGGTPSKKPRRAGFLREERPMTLRQAQRALEILPLEEVLSLCEKSAAGEDSVCKSAAFWRAVLRIQHGIDVENLDDSKHKLLSAEEKEYLSAVLAEPIGAPAEDIELEGVIDDANLVALNNPTSEISMADLLASIALNASQFGKFFNVRESDAGFVFWMNGVLSSRALKLSKARVKHILNNPRGVEQRQRNLRTLVGFVIEVKKQKVRNGSLYERQLGAVTLKVGWNGNTKPAVEIVTDARGFLRCWVPKSGAHVYVMTDYSIHRFASDFLQGEGGTAVLNFDGDSSSTRRTLTKGSDAIRLDDVTWEGISLDGFYPVFDNDGEFVQLREVQLLYGDRIVRRLSDNAFDPMQVDVVYRPPGLLNNPIVRYAHLDGAILAGAKSQVLSGRMSSRNFGPMVFGFMFDETLVPVYATFEANLETVESLQARDVAKLASLVVSTGDGDENSVAAFFTAMAKEPDEEYILLVQSRMTEEYKLR